MRSHFHNRKCGLILLLLFLMLLPACGKKEAVTEYVISEEEMISGYENKKDYVVTVRPDSVVYRLPDESSEVYIKLNTGVNLKRTGTKEGWTRIRLNDTSLYIRSENVKETRMEWVKDTEIRKNSHVVYIDPAKQIYADKKPEALFPDGDAEKQGKPRMSGAYVGTGTGHFEYDVTLEVAEKLKKELELRGYTVILSRTAGTTSISNSERAIMGNHSEAEIMIRLTASGSSNKETKGIFGLIASAKNPNNSAFYQDSFYLANSLVTETCTGTEATRMGIYQTDKMVFLNYAKKPTAVIQLGFLSNVDEDKLLSDPEYQLKLAEGIAKGIDSYFAYKDAEAPAEGKNGAAADGGKTGTTDSQDGTAGDGQNGADADNRDGEGADSQDGQDADRRDGQDADRRDGDGTDSQDGQDADHPDGEDGERPTGEVPDRRVREDADGQNGQDGQTQDGQDGQTQDGQDRERQDGQDGQEPQADDLQDPDITDSE